jgi:hypothetical protein
MACQQFDLASQIMPQNPEQGDILFHLKQAQQKLAEINPKKTQKYKSKYHKFLHTYIHLGQKDKEKEIDKEKERDKGKAKEREGLENPKDKRTILRAISNEMKKTTRKHRTRSARFNLSVDSRTPAFANVTVEPSSVAEPSSAVADVPFKKSHWKRISL